MGYGLCGTGTDNINKLVRILSIWDQSLIHKKTEPEINNRITNVNKLYYSLNKTFIRIKEISIETKLKIFNTVYLLTYDTETWTLPIK